MPGIAENRHRWSTYNWAHEGHSWSPGGTSGGTDMMWWRTIRPRLHRHLPSGTLLEIAPGFGRWTTFLLAESRQLIGVDVTDRCVTFCRERFAATSSEFWVNDGESLPMIPDASIDFAFSFDSLVHVEAPQIGRYLHELSRTLTPGAAAFLHHSNLGAYLDARTGEIPAWVTERHWRAASVSARVVRQLARDAGLHCVTQEAINWIGRNTVVNRFRLPAAAVPLTDCFSVCVRPIAQGPRTTTVRFNRQFVDEWRELVQLARLYAPCGEDHGIAPDDEDGAGPVLRLRRAGARAKRHAAGRLLAWREPIAAALRANRCPDCGAGTLVARTTRACRACDVTFVLS